VIIFSEKCDEKPRVSGFTRMVDKGSEKVFVVFLIRVRTYLKRTGSKGSEGFAPREKRIQAHGPATQKPAGSRYKLTWLEFVQTDTRTPSLRGE
jgi:hypothetical protein